MTAWTTGLLSTVSKLALEKTGKKKLWFSCKLAGFYAYLYVFPTLKCDLQILSHSLIFCFLQNVFNMVVEVPRWTNAKMEVTILQSLA